MYKVIEKRELVPNIHLLKIEVPLIANKIQPGQFIMVMSDIKGERIPLTIADWDTNSITTVFMEVGISTHKLTKLGAGDSLPVVVGPLGRPSSCQELTDSCVVCAGGCYGIGAIFPVVRALKNKGNKVITVIEARSKYLIYWQEKLAQVSDELVITTKDGSSGKKGYASLILKDVMAHTKIDRIYAMGCTFMIMDCSLATRDSGVPIMVSLNSIMVDGTGMCGACRIEVGGETKFACVDGPEFDGQLVNFELLVKRRSIYLSEENQSVSRV